MAVAGDRVVVRQGFLCVNNRPAQPFTAPSLRWGFFLPFGKNRRRSVACASQAARASYSLGATVIPEGHILVLGDNRDASFDSHVWGPLPVRNVVGLVRSRYWPLERIAWF